MSYRRRHRWFRRMAVGLAFASVMLVGRVSVATAKIDEGSDSSRSTTVIPYLSHGMLTEADARAAAASTIRDRYPSESVASIDGDALAIANAIEAQQLTQTPYMSLAQGTYGRGRELPEPFVAGVTDFPRVEVDLPAVRPDDLGDRFAHSDVVARPELTSSGDTSFERNDAVVLGLGAIALAIALGLALGHLRRPRLAGL
jgi:hypothetical protein